MAATTVRMLHIIAEELQSVILQRQFNKCPGLLLERNVLLAQWNKEYVRLINEVEHPKTGRAPFVPQQRRTVPRLE
jgi:hypothetical protein